MVTNGYYEQSGIGNVISQSGGVLVNENNQLKISSNGSSGYSRGVWATGGLEGDTFLIEADIISTSGSVRFYDQSNNGTYTDLVVGSRYQRYIVLGSNDKNLGFGGNNDVNFELVLDNVSIKKFTGNVVVPYSGTGSLLLEPQSNNLITYSADFSSWSNISATLTSNQSSPDGFNNAYIIEDDSASSYERVDETITTTAAPHTFSVFIKKKTSSVSSYSGIQMGTGFSYVIFDSYNGTYNQQSNTNYNSIEVKSFNSEWWRLKLTATVTTSTRVALWGAISVNGTSISTAAIGSETFFGAQLEEKSYATSYIPTSGSTVTRNAEVCNNSGSAQDFSEEGVLYAEFATFSKSYNFPTIQLSDGTSNNGVRIFPIGLGTNNIQVQVDSGGSISFVSTSTNNDPTQYNKIAVKYQKDNFSFYINGTQHATDSSGNAPVGLNIFSFLNNFFGKVKDVKIFNKALTDRELEILTIQ